MNKELMFSSKSEVWSTPQDFYDKYNAKYHFNLEPCATSENAKCEEYYTEEDNGLIQNWGGYRVFCNPPYGRGIGKWVAKGYAESKKPNTTVVMLLPARTDTAWFHDYCAKGKIEFLRGRLKFGESNNNAPFPSMVVVFE